MSKKNTMSSYKVDFKFTLKDTDGTEKEFDISKFTRNSYSWGRAETCPSQFDNEILKRSHPHLFEIPEGKSYWQTPASEMTESAKFDLLAGNPIYNEVDAAFAKWSERRQGVRDIFAKVFPDQQFDIFTLATHHWEKKFLRQLEQNRPVKFHVGQLVTIANNASKHLYDPFYYKRDFENKTRVGVVTKWTDDTGRRAGAGSREMRIMWLASGDITQVPIRLLRAWERPEENKEAASA